MLTEAVSIKMGDGLGLADALATAVAGLDDAQRELILDFSSIRRIDCGALRAMENLAQAAEEKGVRVTLRGVPSKVYKVLKLMKLTQRLAFEN